jgi:hypothetical protein
MDEALSVVSYWQNELSDILKEAEIHPDFKNAYGPSIEESAKLCCFCKGAFRQLG